MKYYKITYIGFPKDYMIFQIDWKKHYINRLDCSSITSYNPFRCEKDWVESCNLGNLRVKKITKEEAFLELL